MVWARLDDGFFDHPKAIAAGKDGRELFLAGVCHASANLTDGFIASHVLPLLAVKAQVKGTAALNRLVELDWWKPVDGGWVIPSFLDFNPSREKVEADREAAAERQRRRRRDNNGTYTRESRRDNQRDQRRESRPPHPDPSRPVGPGDGDSGSNSVTDTTDPAFEGGSVSVDTSLPAETTARNVESVRAVKAKLRGVA